LLGSGCYRHYPLHDRTLSRLCTTIVVQAATDEELEEGISSVAAPVRVADEHGERAVAAVSVVAPSQRLHRDGVTTIAAHVQDAARRIGLALASG
jgi:DNA-binding IclR family transcriptional regulator